ncbi:hypothetical protein Tco_0417426 [Tanacetum coccineum]
MVEPEKPVKFKGKDQIALDEELARKLEAEMQAELVEEERIERQREEEANLISWDDTQAMMEADFELAQRLQAEEQGEITIEERSRLFNMAGYKHNQLKSKSYDEIQKLFDKEMKRVNSFVPMVVEDSKKSKSDTEHKSSTKRACDELEQEKAKKKKINDDQEEAELKKHIEIVKDDDIDIDAIPLAIKPPMIIEYKIVREGIMGHYQLIRADGSSRRYSSMIKMLQNIRNPLEVGQS